MRKEESEEKPTECSMLPILHSIKNTHIFFHKDFLNNHML